MDFFVFRNNTVERFFPKGYRFSGYEDISRIPGDADCFVWFYQCPVECDSQSLSQKVTSYLDSLVFVLERIPREKTLIAFTLSNSFSVRIIENDFQGQKAISEYNQKLFELESGHPNLKVVDFSEFTSNYPVSDLIDWRFYFLSQMGLSPKLAGDFQTWWQKKLDSIALKRKKCIVLDLDNTLWGGVLGEDGVEGIKIGGDYPGKAFLFFQKALLELSKSGVILTICSKNNESDVLEAWDKNPFIVLKKNAFSAYRINWQDKATNIKELSGELNIGLDSMVFIDDNPTERELVKQMLPMVSVPDFPAQPYGLPAFYSRLVDQYFRVYSVTAEDRHKTEQYKANAARSQAQREFTDYESFLRSLDIHLSIEEANSFNIPRIAQMTQKTNQFNLTTKRYTDSDIAGFISAGWRIWCLSVSDRFGDNGITGTVLINGDEIDSLLLSCRILGKGIESAFVKSILSILKSEGIGIVKACYIPTAKNRMTEDFYERIGFECVSNTAERKDYRIDLQNTVFDIDDYYHIDFV